MPVFADVIPYPWYGYWYAHEVNSLSTFWRILVLIIFLALLAYWIICLRKIFKKAWLPGRWSLIPFYRECLWFKMVWWSWRWTASMICPAMFIFILVFSYFKTAEKFGKDKEQFGMWLMFIHPVFLWILAFDKSKYNK